MRLLTNENKKFKYFKFILFYLFLSKMKKYLITLDQNQIALMSFRFEIKSH